MKLVCPSCQSSFEAKGALAAGPGRPLCDAGSKSPAAPPPPPARRAPMVAISAEVDLPPPSEAAPISFEVVLTDEAARPEEEAQEAPIPLARRSRPDPAEVKPSFFRFSRPAI